MATPRLDPARFLRRLLDEALEAVSAARCVPAALPQPPPGRTVVLGAGKAAAAMAAALEAAWTGPLSGLVCVPHGHAVPRGRIEVVEAAHPVPDRAGLVAARRILDLARGLGEGDLALGLLSGGASALLALPAPGVTFEDKRRVGALLLRSGATIREINTVRKHLSAIKGGRLAIAAHPARTVALLVSDVPGDDPAVIASGPTVPDPSTFAEALAALERHGIAAPTAVIAHLRRAADETPKPGDPRLARSEAVLVARPRQALEAAAAAARRQGVEPHLLGDDLQGEARELAARHADLARRVARGLGPVAPPCVLLSGGETTVTVTGAGRGGRNGEYLLALALALGGERGVHALACDTDGIDGAGDNAGAVAAPETLARSRAAGLDAAARLANNDAYPFFATLGDLVLTGPTRTNVGDFRAILVMPVSAGADAPGFPL